MAYGPVSKVVFTLPPPAESGGVVIQNIGPMTLTGPDSGTFSVRVPALTPDSPWEHVVSVLWAVAWGDDPYGGVPPEALEVIDSDQDPNYHVGTQALAADDEDAGDLKTIEVDFTPGTDVYTAYFWVDGTLA
jgi:hypothetical protein